MKTLKVVVLVLCFAFRVLPLSEQQMDEEIIEDAKQRFEEADTDKNHMISFQEYIDSFKQLTKAGFDKTKLQQLNREDMETYDINNNNGLDWQEYLNMTLIKVQNHRHEEKLKRLNPPDLDSL